MHKLRNTLLSSKTESKDPETPKMQFFITLVVGWRPQTNDATRIFILDIAMVLDMSNQIYFETMIRLIKNITSDLYFLKIWIIVSSELLRNLTINNKTPIILINGSLWTIIFWSYNITRWKEVPVLTDLEILFLMWGKHAVKVSLRLFLISCTLPL